MSTPRLIALTDIEVDSLFGIGPLGALLYLTLRMAMDYHNGTTGRSTPISLHRLAMASETHTQRGAGTQITRPSEKEVRNALAKLQRAGLLLRLPGDRLAFSLPLALTASSRPIQTGHGEAVDSSTEPGNHKSAPLQGVRAEPGARFRGPQRPNRAHVYGYENQNLLPKPDMHVDNLGEERRLGDGHEIVRDCWPSWATIRPDTARHARHVVKSGFAEGGSTVPPADAEEQRLLVAGRKRGIEPRPGESWAQFRVRVFRLATTSH